MDIVAVAAVSENGVIGDGRELPWHLPNEVRRYRERVEDETVVLGRRTFEMMLDDLPGSNRIVMSRTERTYDDPTVTHAGGVDEAIEIAERGDVETLYVLGGAEIYEAFLPEYDRMLLSRIDGEYEGDVTFPDFDGSTWDLVDEARYDGYTLETWESAENTGR